jgi:aryl-alcohol dehydrogenase-like predicted oxidoreductase
MGGSIGACVLRYRARVQAPSATVTLGRSALQVSRVVFGAMALSSSSRDPVQREQTVRAAVDAGITSIDTAPLYDFGACEELLGQALAGLRSRVQILTKVGLRWDDPQAHGQVLFPFVDASGRPQAVRRNSRPESVRLEVERSLQRLRVDTLDLVQVHHPDPDTPIEDTMGALADLLRAGKLRAIGVSNYSAAQMGRAQAALGSVPLASNQVHYSLLERWPEVEVLPRARAEHIGVLAYSPLERGLLSGDVRRARFAPDDGRRNDPAFHPDNLALIAAAAEQSLAPVARAHDASVAQVALAWLLAQPGLSAVVVGASSAEQARLNARAMALVLTPAEETLIRDAFAAVKLDPHAGLDPLSRVRRKVGRLAARVRRRLSFG